MRELLKGIGLRIDPGLEYHVLGSGLARSLDTYTSWFLLVMAILGALAPAGIAAYLYALRHPPLPVLFMACLALSLGFSATGLALYISLPAIAYRNRASRLEPRFLSFASALATRVLAGSGLVQAFIDLWERGGEELREFRLELEYIASLIRLGAPLDEALSEAAKMTPSPSLKSLLGGLAAAARSGSGVEEVIETVVSEYIQASESYIEEISSSLGALLEIFVALGAMLPIALSVLALLFAIRPPSSPLLSFKNILFI